MFYLFTKVASISAIELEQKLKENIQLIDVRTPGEFRKGHMKNAKNVPLNEIGQFTPITDKTVYVILQIFPLHVCKQYACQALLLPLAVPPLHLG